MTSALFDRLKISFDLMSEIIGHIPESYLSSKLSDLPSNTIGQQLWCVVGARESYTRGIQKGQWDGFQCSLTKEDITKQKEISKALANSALAAQQVLSEDQSLSPAQEKLAFELLEHEVFHQGQLIRYLYGLKLGIPAGLKARYHLD